MLRKITIVLILMTANTSLYAAENITCRKITSIGCHHVDGTCYASLSGEPFGNTLSCPYKNVNQFRFDASTTNGKRTYASLYAAYLSKKLVDVYLDGCSSDGRPSIVWFHIY
ncbi:MULTISPECIES: hypothetical protein [Acinetobacter]|uniref:hypothetical protein n=1 Tax=Acinetobacter TaxID=469 RepID=UPI00141ADEEA|nr:MULTISPECIES: hypothetical protein [Acinetobacter]MCS4296863.1 hypothetical protein [Acinetobacter guillouiae]MCW2250985.1 hypothetical protein [Acinetobacter sp. BIGb0204]NII36917.1 hypothetical protein [Acinetobacter sp. BIGb0196]